MRSPAVGLYTVIFGLSSGNLPSGSSSTSETVVVDRIDVFLNFGVECLEKEREDGDQTAVALSGGDAIGVPRRVQNWLTWMHREWFLHDLGCRKLFSQRELLQSMIARIMCLWKC